jgi:peptide/nickel transport system substrate-binding protein
MRRIRLIACALAAAFVTAPAQAENVVRWATTFSPAGFDPHAYDNIQTSMVQQQVFEPLVCYDLQDKLQPCLAVSWKQLDPLTWEFALRRGVTFHDGTPFTSADVVFSFERARADTSADASVVSDITGVEARGADAVRIVTRKPDFLLWDKASFVRVLSKAWAEAHDARLPARPEDLATAYPSSHANGTGPFMLESFEPGRRTVLVRNPRWWGLEQYPHNIDRIEQLKVDAPEQGMAMLLRGKVDFVQEIPTGQLDRVRAAPGVRLEQGEAALTQYLGFDLTSPELRTANIKGRNPFRDKRVRQAVYQAIDFEQVRAALDGLAAPAGMILGRTAVGYEEELDRRLSYDPARARELLAEAGYADGFDVALDCSNFREPACRAIPPMLAEIGIRVNLRIRSAGELNELVQTHATDLYRWGYDEELDSSYVFRARYDSRAAMNTGYADPEVDRLIEAIEAEISTYPRLGLIEQVWRKVLDDIVYVPLYRVVNVWAMRERLDMPMGINPWPVFKFARVKEGGPG